MASKLAPIKIIQQTSKHTGTVVFFHGSGDTAEGVYDWVKLLTGQNFTFPHLKILFPTAPVRPYTPFGGQMSNVWFDRLDIKQTVPEHTETLEDACNLAREFIEEESKATNIPLNRMIIGGFSMGGALALHLGYRTIPNFAGVFAMSSFLNDGTKVYDAVKRNPSPLFMCHGDEDTLVPMKWAENTFHDLKRAGVMGSFYSLSGTVHEMTRSELNKLHTWISKTLS